jgi:3'-phosphoadenosine 5'-phosphosulfate sulfotransferase (PAPS reductase)/FAD synthetase
MSNVDILVPISGGKDSQAAAKLARETYPNRRVRGLFCDTRFEHPWTYAHVDKIARLYDIEIVKVSAGSVVEQCAKHKRFPGGGSRFCTKELKMIPTKKYTKWLAESQGSRIASKRHGISGSKSGGFEVWYGMRSDESTEREKRYIGKVCDDLYAPHEVLPHNYPQYLGELGVMFRLAILDWSRQDVIDFVGWENLNPLYHHGFDRVGCFPCQAAGDPHKEKSYAFDEFGRKTREVIHIVSQFIDKPMFNSKGGQERNPDTCALHCQI